MSAWSDEEDAALFRMWKIEGLSAAICARKLPGDRTKNAITGRVHRLGWSRPNAAAPGSTLPYPKRACTAPKIERKAGRGFSFGSAAARAIGQRRTPDLNALPELRGADIESPNAKVWIERAFGECAYPLEGRGEGADTVSCCNATGGLTYCGPHAKLMANPNQSRSVNPSDLGASTRPRRTSRGAEGRFSSWLEDAA